MTPARRNAAARRDVAPARRQRELSRVHAMHALDGVRILDLSGGIAGPLGVLQLAEHGADVIKIEPPGGAPTVALPASPVYDRSRRSVTLDLQHADGARLFRELCGTADVVVEAFAPGTMAQWGLDYESLHDEFPQLVYCSIPAWPSGSRFEDYPGLRGARPRAHRAALGDDQLPQRAGVPAQPGREPRRHDARPHRDHVGTRRARPHRSGQHVEVSLLAGRAVAHDAKLELDRPGSVSSGETHPPGIHQSSIYECADGEWIHAAVSGGGLADAERSIGPRPGRGHARSTCSR